MTYFPIDSAFNALNKTIDAVPMRKRSRAALKEIAGILQSLVLEKEGATIQDEWKASRLEGELASVRIELKEAQERIKRFQSVGLELGTQQLKETILNAIDYDPSKKIYAIKYVRDLTNCGLREAKEWVETFDLFKPVELKDNDS